MVVDLPERARFSASMVHRVARSTAALVAGLKPLEFKVEVEGALQMKGDWKEDPLQCLARCVLRRWTGVWWSAPINGVVIKLTRGKSTRRDKSGQRPYRGNNGSWTCGEVGHRSYGCGHLAREEAQTRVRPLLAARLVPREGPSRRPKGASAGTPAARGASQQRPTVHAICLLALQSETGLRRGAR